MSSARRRNFHAVSIRYGAAQYGAYLKGLQIGGRSRRIFDMAQVSGKMLSSVLAVAVLYRRRCWLHGRRRRWWWRSIGDMSGFMGGGGGNPMQALSGFIAAAETH
jgi:hypothetical protein